MESEGITGCLAGTAPSPWSSPSDNLQLKNAKKARKYAIFWAFSIPKILSGLFGFDGIWTEIYGFIVVKLLVDKPILTSYGSNYWWTIGANEVQFCHRRTNTYLTDLHRALAHSLKTRMGRGSIFFARNPARQIWVPQDQIGNAGLACGTEDRAGNPERGREEKTSSCRGREKKIERIVDDGMQCRTEESSCAASFLVRIKNQVLCVTK